MQALVLENYRDLRLREVDVPEIGALDVLIEVKACGICGSDVHGFDGSTGRRIPPVIMGHEAAGVVAKVGAKVASVQVGDRVTFDSTISCGASVRLGM
jgi:L-iditol 2-dehydrogenase